MSGHNHESGGIIQPGMIIFIDQSITGAITDPENRTTELSDCLSHAFKGFYVCNGKTTTDRVKNVTLPDLRNKFIRCAMTSGGIGGSDDAVVVSHNHDFYYVLLGAAGTARGVANNSGSSFKTSTDGESGVGKNMPAYHELIPIMRVMP